MLAALGVLLEHNPTAQKHIDLRQVRIVDILKDVPLLLVDCFQLMALIDELPSSGITWTSPASFHTGRALRYLLSALYGIT
jgi:hypothetical protein